MSSEVMRAGATLVGRLLLAALFVLGGWGKVRGYAPAAAYMERYSVPGSLLPAVIALELGGGLLLAIGWQTRLAALALAVFCVLAAVQFHGNLADRSHLLHFEKDLAIAGGLLVLFAAGAGRYAVDEARHRAQSKPTDPPLRRASLQSPQVTHHVVHAAQRS